MFLAHTFHVVLQVRAVAIITNEYHCYCRKNELRKMHVLLLFDILQVVKIHRRLDYANALIYLHMDQPIIIRSTRICE